MRYLGRSLAQTSAKQITPNKKHKPRPGHSGQKGMNMPNQLECVEVCPHCGNENVYENIDPVAVGYKMVCNGCGAEIMLCDECMHADDNPCGKCNWHEEIRGGKKVGVCFRGVTTNKS